MRMEWKVKKMLLLLLLLLLGRTDGGRRYGVKVMAGRQVKVHGYVGRWPVHHRPSC